MNVLERLYSLRDEEYRIFSQKIAPTLPLEVFLGIRVPNLREIAKEMVKNNDYKEFLKSLPHRYYEENLLHSCILCLIKDYDEVIEYVEAFLPYIDNWAVSDTLRPKAFKKNKDVLLPRVLKWCSDSKLYTIRVGVNTLMDEYLDKDFKKEYLEIPAKIISEEYYVNMMIAWYYATALAKQWDDTIIYLTNNRLGKWVHNKTIQKAVESFRITEEQKIYLKTLRRK